MSVKKQEIIFYLSGGLSNRDPLKSIGGPISNTEIWYGLDNLFNDLILENEIGYMDYRCFYVKNGGDTEWKDVSIYLKNQTVGCATGLLGVLESDDIQQFNIISDSGVTGGSFSFKIGNYQDVTVEYPDCSGISGYSGEPGYSCMDLWAINFENAMASIGFLETNVVGKEYVNISSSQYQNKTFQIFQIEFTGQDGHRNEEAIEPDQNNLSGSASTLTSNRVIRGAPINTEASQIPNITSTPHNIIFQPTIRTSPLYLGTFKPGDIAPIWIKRTTEGNPESMQTDVFTVALRGTDYNMFTSPVVQKTISMSELSIYQLTNLSEYELITLDF